MGPTVAVSAAHQSCPGDFTAPKKQSIWPTTILVASSLLVFGSVVTIAVHHLGDSHNLDIGSGIFIALAQECRHGRLYPDLRAGDLFGGTRYMPLPFVMQ